MALHPDVIDLRITAPTVARVDLASRENLLNSDVERIWRSLESIKAGHQNFYMTALDYPEHPGLTKMVLEEQYATLRTCPLVKWDLAYWERPFRVDDDWASPGYLTDTGEQALAAARLGYCWSLRDRAISMGGTRDFYKQRLRWADKKDLVRLSALPDDWLADLQACIKPVRKGYKFNPVTEMIDIDLTIRAYMALPRHRLLTQHDYKVVRAMNDPAMQEVLTAMAWIIMIGEPAEAGAGIVYRLDGPGWTVPEDVELPF